MMSTAKQSDAPSTDRPSDEAILKYEQSVKDQEANIVHYVGDLEPLANVQQEYHEGARGFQRKLQTMEKSFDRVRRCRGDGNCFFRAFGYRYFEAILADIAARRLAKTDPRAPDSALTRALAVVSTHIPLLQRAKFDEFAYGDFLEVFTTTLENLVGLVDTHLQSTTTTMTKPSYASTVAPGGSKTLQERLVDMFRNSDVSNYVVVHLRFVTSAFLKTHRDEYEPFLGGEMSMDMYCNTQVEAMDREADEIHIIGLTNAMQQGLTVVYLDAGDSAEPTIHRFEPAQAPENDYVVGNVDTFSLLYRPGHYDILYRLDAVVPE